MQNLIAIWSALDLRRRVIVVGATVAMFARRSGAGPHGRHARTWPCFMPVLNQPAAGEVVAALDQRGVAYEVRGDSIYVDAAQRDSLRMALAVEGPAAAGGGGL